MIYLAEKWSGLNLYLIDKADLMDLGRVKFRSPTNWYHLTANIITIKNSGEKAYFR